jgi:hypothetical protein
MLSLLLEWECTRWVRRKQARGVASWGVRSGECVPKFATARNSQALAIRRASGTGLPPTGPSQAASAPANRY